MASGKMDGNAMISAGLLLFAELSNQERRVIHLLMADQMENDPDQIRELVIGDIYEGGE